MRNSILVPFSRCFSFDAPIMERWTALRRLHISSHFSDGLIRYGNVSESEAFRNVWPGEDGMNSAREFIDRIEALRKQGNGDQNALEKESRREIEAVIDWCRGKFGEGEMSDASQVWVQPSKEHKEIGEKMIIGGEGWRTF